MKKHMKNTLLGLCVGALALVGSAAEAQSKQVSIAFVDGQQIMQQFTGAIDKKLQKEFATRKDKVEALEKDVSAQAEKLKRDESILSDSDLKKSKQSLEVKQRDLQRMGQALQEDYQLRGNQELQAVGEKIKAAVDQVAQEKSFDMVLQRGAAVFVDKKYDITQDVLNKLEKAKA